MKQEYRRFDAATSMVLCATTGLDPIIATTVDDEIVKLRDLQHVTSIAVTHQIRDAYYIATNQAVSEEGCVRIVPAEATSAAPAEFMVLHEGRIRFDGSATELLASRDQYLKDSCSGRCRPGSESFSSFAEFFAPCLCPTAFWSSEAAQSDDDVLAAVLLV